MEEEQEIRDILEETIKKNNLVGKYLLELKWRMRYMEPAEPDAVQILDEEDEPPVTSPRRKSKKARQKEAEEPEPAKAPEPQPVPTPQPVKAPTIYERLIGKDADQKARERAKMIAELEAKLLELKGNDQQR